MFSTQRSCRGAALVASAALGLGGSVAPATLAPATFASAAHAQTQQSEKPELPIAVAADVYPCQWHPYLGKGAHCHF